MIIKSGTTTALTFSGANLTAAGTIDSGAITSTGVVTGTGFTIGSAAILEAELEILDGANVTTAELNLLDGSAKSTSSITVADADAIIVIDGTTTKQIPASDIKTYVGSGAVTAINNATANELVTIGSTTTELDAEANLTFDGSTFAVTGDATISDDLGLISDAAVLTFGANSEITVTHVHDTGLNFKHTATGDDKPVVLTLQTGETDIAANDVIGKVAFQAPDEGTGTDAILVAAAIQARSEGDFASDANATSIDFMTGASEAAATKWSITSAGTFLNAGTNKIDMNAGELILDADADTSITADTDDQIDIRIAGADDFQFTANTFTAASGSGIIQTDGIHFIGDTANASTTQGLVINQAGADNEILAFKSSDVAHGITNYAEADTYASFKKVSATAGGLLIQGFAESGLATGIEFNAMSEAAPSTGAGTGAQATCKHYAVLSDGSAGFTAFASNSIIHAWGLFTGGGSAQLRMCLDEDGDLFLDGAVGTAFDSYDDAALLRAFSNHSSPDQVIKTSFDKWVGYNLEDLQAARIISDPGEDEGRPMWNIGQHTKLLTGAAVQQRAMFETMKEVAEDMLPGFAEKLNKKLAEQSLPALPVSA